MRAKLAWVEPYVGDPLLNEPSVLPGRQAAATTPTSKQELSCQALRQSQIVVDRLARVFDQFEPDWSISFFCRIVARSSA